MPLSSSAPPPPSVLAPRLSIVIPVYDAPDLRSLADRLLAVLGPREAPFEVLFVDDASPNPAIWPTLAALAAAHPEIRALQLTRNFGQAAATLCGLAAARGEVVVTLDDDLQHPPEELPRLLDAPAADIVMGQFRERHHSFSRRLASRVKGRFDRWILGKPAHLQLTSLRRLSRPVVDGMLAQRTPHPFLPALMFRVSRDVIGVEVDHAPRIAGPSTYTLRRLLRLFSHLLIGNSSLLLRLVAAVGCVTALSSFVVAASVVYRRLRHGIALPGWASLFVIQALIGGLLLLAVGILGEYLIRILETSETRPAYFVRRRAGGATDGASS